MNYSGNSTPAVRYVANVNAAGLLFSRTGKHLTTADGSGTWTNLYDGKDRLVGMACASGLMQGLALTNRYDTFDRRISVGVTGSSGVISTGFGFDSLGRWSSVTNGNSLVSYSFVANSDLLQTTTFKHSASTLLTTTRRWDYGSRLQRYCFLLVP